MILRRAVRRRRRAPVGITVRIAGTLLLLATTSLMSAAPAPAQPVNARSVTVSIQDVSPTSPPTSTTPSPLTVSIALTNNTDQSLSNLVVLGERGNPITTRTELDSAIQHPAPPDPNLAFQITTPKPVTSSLAPRGTTAVTFTMLTSTDSSTTPGLCICETRIYPLYFAVHAHDPSGADVVVGTAQTFVPAFSTPPPKPVRVSWVWPIIDRPHRLVGDTAFTDDDLSYSIEGGRLDRVLSVVERVAQRSMAMTLIVDPELLDELAIMATGSYTVDSGGKSVAGSGTAAARDWLMRLRTALAADPKLELDFTPLADPDVETLSRKGLAWTTGLGPQIAARVGAALGGKTAETGIGWPVDGVLTSPTLDQLVRDGASSVIVSDATLPSAGGADATANQLGILQTPAGQVTAAVMQRSIQQYVSPVLSLGRSGTAQLPDLVSEVAIAAISGDQQSPYVAIVAPRDVNPVPDVAERAIVETASAFWSTSLTIDSAAHTVTPSDHGQLVPPPGSVGALSDLTIDAARQVSHVVPALATMMSAADASRLLGSLPIAVQRAESSAWRTAPAAGDEFAAALTTRIATIESGVHIVRPSAGTYTLTSTNSPLPITVENTLGVTVRVRVEISSANDLPGFSANEVNLQTIAPNTKVTLHVPTHVERTGRFTVQAILVTPSDVRIGDPVLLSVHSTALGTIGVIITVTAAIVLVVALLVRLIRRLSSRRRAPNARPAA
ncbi:MAG TPA: hypothetical protein VGN35_10480 [Jatrophihabitantaceae bacterium]|nr:hypothetical protein [Jatrophihabitantaceae bacterium]